MAWSRRFELFAKPLFDIIRPVPALAWIPLMILWLGIGYASKVGIIFFAAFISATVNSYTGIRRTSQVHLWVGKPYDFYRSSSGSGLCMGCTGSR